MWNKNARKGMNHSNIKIGIRKKMKNKFETIFEQLADFNTLSGYDGWMIGACVYAQRGAEHVSNEKSCKSEIVKETASFAVMRNQMELEGMYYQLELHVVKPDVQGEVSSKQAGMEENMGMNVEKLKSEERWMNLHHAVKTEEIADTGEGKTFSFTHSDILRFVDVVGDMNSLHRTAHAVVPGLLMVEWMLDIWMKKQPETKTDVEMQAGVQVETQNVIQAGMKNEMQAGTQAGMPGSGTFICRFRFEKPVYVDERLHVEIRNTRGKQVYECKREDKEIVWNMRIL